MASRFERASQKARQRYDMDYWGIVLNVLVSATSSISAATVLDVLDKVSTSELPIIAAAVFFAQIVPKLLIEFHKSYNINKARQKGYKEGLLNDNFNGKEENSDDGQKTTVRDFFSMCEHASYY